MAEEQKKAGAPSQKKVAVKKGAPAQVTTQAVKKGEELTRFGKIKKWFREMKSELKKVVWPARKQLVNNTLIVLGAVLVVGIIVVFFDWIAGQAVSLLGEELTPETVSALECVVGAAIAYIFGEGAVDVARLIADAIGGCNSTEQKEVQEDETK